MRTYPTISDGDTDTLVQSLKLAVNYIARERNTDISDFNNLPNKFISGRKVGRVPAGTTLAIATDRVGDINYDTSYLYICENQGSTAIWLRTSLSSW